MAKEDDLQGRLHKTSPAAALLGRRVIGVDAETGEFVVSYEATASFTNRHGTVQGGFLAAMLDSATGLAVLSRLPADKTAVTTHLKLRFAAPARPGCLRVYSSIKSLTDRKALVIAALRTPEGDTVATAEAELRIVVITK